MFFTCLSHVSYNQDLKALKSNMFIKCAQKFTTFCFENLKTPEPWKIPKNVAMFQSFFNQYCITAHTPTLSLPRAKTLTRRVFCIWQQSEGEAPVLEIWGMWSTPSLPLLPGPLWPGVVAPNRVLSIGQIEQNMCEQMTDVKLWRLYSHTWNHLTGCKKELWHIYDLNPQNVFTNHLYI